MRMPRPGEAAGRAALTLAVVAGFVFLYLPLVVLVAYSFNASKLVSVWGGWSVQWYGELFRNEQILGAAWLSLKIAAINASGATMLGTMAGLALARFGRFPGRTLFSGLIAAPLVMPEIIIGISMLLTFVILEQLVGWPAGRGMDTILIAHITFSTAFVAIVVQARAKGLDRSIEEAALDLGAPPMTAFFLVTLPMLAPALASGWLLAFTLSLDDLVIASFVSGPGSSTLPMVIFSKVRLGVSPDVNALATLLIAFVAIVVGGLTWLQMRRTTDGLR